jgi:DNA-binding NarL/FixJ family response regulator
MSAKILIVDDHDVVRQGLRTFLAARPEWEVCGEASEGEEAVRAVASLRPDVVVLDVTMPGMSGLEAASRIVALGTGARILIFTMHESQRMAIDVREAGAHGLVQKSRASHDLIAAIERVLAGDTFFDGESQDRSEGEKPEASAPPAKRAANPGSSFRAALAFA